MKISDGHIIVTEHDVIIRHLILFHEKLLDESANQWFREYCKENTKFNDFMEVDTDSVNDDYVNKYLQEHFNFSDKDFGVWLLKSRVIEIGLDRASLNFTVTGDAGKVVFDSYNGFWYTATKTGIEHHLVLFDYGDFYCLGNVFPLATYFVLCAKKWDKEHKEGN